MKKVYSIALAFIVAITLIACTTDKKSETNAQETEAMSSSQNTGQVKAPAFTLKDSEGNDLSLSDYSGKVILLDFWATWCPPCRVEIPGFIELQNEYKEKGLQVIGVSLDQKGWGVVKPFMEEYGINYPIVLLTDQNVYNAYQELLSPNMRGSIPFTFILDKQGVIVEQHVGFGEKDFFENIIKPLL